MASETRATAYAAALERAGADAFVLTSEPGVRHACGVALYTQRLIPQRPVVCICVPPRTPVLVCCELEEEQLRADHPGLELVTFREFGDDPWAKTAEALAGCSRVVVEDTLPTAWLTSLWAGLAADLVVSYDVAVEPRMVKDDDEQRLLEEASEVAEDALAAGAALVQPGRTEREVASAIVRRFLDRLGERATELAGSCIAPQNNRAMHHVAGADVLPDRGPVRLGVVGRVDGYWILITRMLLLGKDARFVDAYRRYLDAYEETMATLRAGATGPELYDGCRRRVRGRGFALETLKIGHGTGLDFRERPWLSEYDETPLAPGMVLAYDYGIDTGDYVLHLEDRVLVTSGPPRRLSSRWDLAELRP
jgi:Xaa-Pro aminopeptidase